MISKNNNYIRRKSKNLTGKDFHLKIIGLLLICFVRQSSMLSRLHSIYPYRSSCSHCADPSPTTIQNNTLDYDTKETCTTNSPYTHKQNLQQIGEQTVPHQTPHEVVHCLRIHQRIRCPKRELEELPKTQVATSPGPAPRKRTEGFFNLIQ